MSIYLYYLSLNIYFTTYFVNIIKSEKQIQEVKNMTALYFALFLIVGLAVISHVEQH